MMPLSLRPARRVHVRCHGADPDVEPEVLLVPMPREETGATVRDLLKQVRKRVRTVPPGDLQQLCLIIDKESTGCFEEAILYLDDSLNVIRDGDRLFARPLPAGSAAPADDPLKEAPTPRLPQPPLPAAASPETPPPPQAACERQAPRASGGAADEEAPATAPRPSSSEPPWREATLRPTPGHKGRRRGAESHAPATGCKLEAFRERGERQATGKGKTNQYPGVFTIWGQQSDLTLPKPRIRTPGRAQVQQPEEPDEASIQAFRLEGILRNDGTNDDFPADADCTRNWWWCVPCGCQLASWRQIHGHIRGRRHRKSSLDEREQLAADASEPLETEGGAEMDDRALSDQDMEDDDCTLGFQEDVYPLGPDEASAEALRAADAWYAKVEALCKNEEEEDFREEQVDIEIDVSDDDDIKAEAEAHAGSGADDAPMVAPPVEPSDGELPKRKLPCPPRGSASCSAAPGAHQIWRPRPAARPSSAASSANGSRRSRSLAREAKSSK